MVRHNRVDEVQDRNRKNSNCGSYDNGEFFNMAAMKNIKGYSIIEIMVTVAILGTIASIAPMVFTKVYDFFKLSETKMVIQRDTRASLDIINRSLRQAEKSSIMIDSLSGQPPCSRIRFKKINDTAYRSFYQQGTTLMESYGATRAIKRADNLRFLAFSFPRSDDQDIISVSMTMEKVTTKGATKAIHVAIEKVRVMNE
jgi:prepilin-type N-terminal cleavage/methylation domain-containing protein